MRTFRHPRRPAGLAVGALLLTVAAAMPAAYAAPPANDSIRHPSAVSTLPATFSQNTREATASASDGRCTYGATVWYRYRPTVTRSLRVTTVGSGYDTVLAIQRGPRTARTPYGCNDDRRSGLFSALQRRFEAGQTYWLAVSACCNPTARGGALELRVYPPTVPQVTSTVTAADAGGVSGRLHIEGITDCAMVSEVQATLRVSQRVADGVGVARGTSFLYLPKCSPGGQPWEVTLDSETSWAFQEGTIALDLHTEASDGIGVGDHDLSDNVPVGFDAAGRRRP